MRLVFSASLQAQLEQAAIAAFPRECCGLIEGLRDPSGFHAIALHPVRNLAAASDRFELDPTGHIAAQRCARANGHLLIGCYHSHPDGEPTPSQTDLRGAAEENFLWAIAATDGVQCRLRAFVYRGGLFEDVLAVGADLVTSSLNERR